MLHQANGDLLQIGIVFFAISCQQLAQLLRAIVQLLLLQNRVDGRGLKELFIFLKQRRRCGCCPETNVDDAYSNLKTACCV